MQVFISHAGSDRDHARRLAEQLKDAGIAVWNPYEEIYPGDNWAKQTSNALESSDVMVALFSRSANDLTTLQHEVQFALTSGNYRGRIVPVLVGFTTFVAGTDVPWILLRFNPIYLPELSPDFTPVVDRVQALAGTACNAAD